MTEGELVKLFEHSPHYRRVPYLMSARTGLRYGELSELVWDDVIFDVDKSHVLVRASISKNKKEARIPLIDELEDITEEKAYEIIANFRKNGTPFRAPEEEDSDVPEGEVKEINFYE